MNALLTGQPGYGSDTNAQNLANIYNTYCRGGNQYTPRPSNQVDCGNGSSCPLGTTCCGTMCCGADHYCSRYGCTPQGARDCGNFYCNPGQKCALNGRGCYPEHVVDCGDYSCEPGLRCAASHRACLNYSDTDCGGYHCSAGQKCSSGRSCIPKDNMDCGAKSQISCDRGRKCSRDGKRLPSTGCGRLWKL